MAHRNAARARPASVAAHRQPRSCLKREDKQPVFSFKLPRRLQQDGAA
ncbi:MAG: hypothetical protein MZV65_18925 [Chromatiales bacterium]|nr:hypothetical protein [Chromatiales bacterium]